jgi:hypothetical protein
MMFLVFAESLSAWLVANCFEGLERVEGGRRNDGSGWVGKGRKRHKY